MDTSSVKRNSGGSADELTLLPTGPGSIAELAQDLSALKAGTPGSVARWACRPAVLRRIAMMLSAGIPAEATRVVVTGEGATAVAAAVALTAGLPYAVLGSAEVEFGEVHSGEDVALITVTRAELAAARAWCDQHGLVITHEQSIFAPEGSAALFIADGDGKIQEGAGQ